MEREDEIVVFQTFENSIEANIIKTKLDAYGIENFLTEENISNLYPGLGAQISSFRVRLHLASSDVKEATRVLAEENYLELDEESITRCPRCNSLRVERDFSKKITSRVLSGLFIALF